MQTRLCGVLMFLYLSVGLQSQSVGLRGGLLFTDFESSQIFNNERVVGWHAGIWTGLDLPLNFMLHAGLGVVQKGSKDGISENRFDLLYLELPLTMRYEIAPVFLQFGGSVNRLLSATFSTIDLKDLLDQMDYGLHAGVGIKLFKFTLDGRWLLGLHNINDLNNDVIKNKGIVIGVEYVF